MILETLDNSKSFSAKCELSTMLEKLKANHYNIDMGLSRPIPILIYIGRDKLTMPVQIEEYFRTPKISNVGIDFKAHLVVATTETIDEEKVKKMAITMKDLLKLY